MTAVDDPSGNGVQPRAAPDPAHQPPTTMPDQHPKWDEPIFRAGILVGAALFLIGILCQIFNLIAPTLSILVICSGLGIIFGAFGSTAVINYKGVVVAGVAALAVVLLLVVHWVMRESLLRIEVDGDVRGKQLALFAENPFPGADRERRYEFYILGNDIKKDRLSLVITWTESREDGTTDKREVAFDCIPSSAVTRFIGAGKTLQWSFDAKTETLSGIEGGTVASGGCRGGTTGPSFAALDGLSLIGTAHAQDGSIPELLADLESDSASVRRNARSALAALGQSAIRPMMDHWATHADSYQVPLGVSVALTEFLRENKRDRKAVSEVLTEADLQLLAVAAGADDRTLRVYASEFLYDLGDPRIVPIAAALFDVASADGRYNLIVVIRGAVPDLSDAEKTSLRDTLTRWNAMVGRNTQQLIADVMAEASA